MIQGTHRYPPMERVIYGIPLAEALAEEVRRTDARAVYVMASGTLNRETDEIDRVRHEAGSPPLAAPIGQIVASQALINVLGANRYATIVDELRELARGHFGHTPAPIDASQAS